MFFLDNGTESRRSEVVSPAPFVSQDPETRLDAKRWPFLKLSASQPPRGIATVPSLLGAQAVSAGVRGERAF